jgi:ATP-binding cassette subfamily B protein/subfamily B ATP-binding cassette protein MsbA
MRHLKLLRYVKPYWRSLLLVLGTMGLGVGFSVLAPWPLKILIDNILGHHSAPGSLLRITDALPGPGGRDGLLLWAVAIASVLIFLGATLASLVESVASVAFGQRITFELGSDLFRHLQRLSLLFHSRRPVGDTIARVTGDPYCVQTLVVGVLLPLVQSVVTLIAMFLVMWTLQPTMTLLSLAVVPLLGLSIAMFAKPMKERSRYRRDLEGEMMSLVQQALSAMPAVQAFTREEIENTRFRSYAKQTVAAYRSTTLAQMWFKLIVGATTALGTAGILWLGGHYALQGKVTTGSIIVFVTYLGLLYGPLSAITYTASTWQSAAANADRVLEILEMVPDVEDAPDARDVEIAGHVRFDDVRFGYEPDRVVLSDISLQAHPGEVVAIVGPTGAGKTTLVNLLLRFYDPDTGRVSIDGHDLRTVRLASLRRQVAIVLQEPFIFPMSVRENIAYGRPDASLEEIRQAAIAANADEFISRMPESYDALVGERGATLSGGEKQRLSIARAFLKDAPILILDEPTSALDARTEGMLLEALERLMAGRTTFIIAHRLSTIRQADRILVLEAGRVVDAGSHDELLAKDGLYASLYRQQMDIRHHEPTPPLPAHG